MLLAGELNVSPVGNIYLYGIGFNLKLPGFAYFGLNLYVRDMRTISGKSYQISPYWSLPFTVGSLKMTFDGFLDYAGHEGNTVANLLTQPQLLVDIGNMWGAPNTLYAGIEYQYWKNKYGVDGVNESLPQAMVKWNF